MGGIPTQGAIEALLLRWAQGDGAALDELIPFVYNDLRRMARYLFRSERPEHTLQPTALVHEAWIKLAGQKTQRWENRAHFLAVAARAMRQVLVEYARRRGAQKRNVVLVCLDSAQEPAGERPMDFVALDQALSCLANEEPLKAKVAELRIFGGLDNEEVAESLGISSNTVIRYWNFAIAYLRREMARKNDRRTT